jgi:polysaccharide export outer membrane protein
MLPAALAGLLGCWLAGAWHEATPQTAPPGRGFHLFSSRQSLITPGMEIQWSVQAVRLPSQLMKGTNRVGPDGRVALGPYGYVQVAGLTPSQAKAVIEKYLAHYLTKPRVSVRVTTPPRPPAVAARPPVRSRPAAQYEPPRSRYTAVGARPAAAPVVGAQLAGQVVTTSAWRPIEGRTAEAGPLITKAGWQTRGTGGGVRTAAGAPAGFLRRAVADEPADGGEAPPAPGVQVPGPLAADGPLPPGLPHPPGGPPVPPTPTELKKLLMPPYVIEPPDILLVESNQGLRDQPIRGQHLVRPDGTIGIGIYGSVKVAGLTLEQARAAIAGLLSQRIKKLDINNVSVDVLAYNSKVYYVIADGGGYGETVVRLPITGNETVLDAVSLITGLPPVASKKKIWVARRTPGKFGDDQILPVDWIGVSQRGEAATNYQILPGDRLYVQSDPWRRFDAGVAKVLSPFERMFGFTLLGSETVNSIIGRSTGTTR